MYHFQPLFADVVTIGTIVAAAATAATAAYTIYSGSNAPTPKFQTASEQKLASLQSPSINTSTSNEALNSEQSQINKTYENSLAVQTYGVWGLIVVGGILVLAILKKLKIL